MLLFIQRQVRHEGVWLTLGVGHKVNGQWSTRTVVPGGGRDITGSLQEGFMPSSSIHSTDLRLGDARAIHTVIMRHMRTKADGLRMAGQKDRQREHGSLTVSLSHCTDPGLLWLNTVL